MTGLPHRFVLFVPALLLAADHAGAQVTVFDNQGNFGFTSIGFEPTPTLWDDLQLTDGGLLSEISFLVDPPSAGVTSASGTIDLRVFDETFNRPQGAPLATIPFSGTFATKNVDFFQFLNIELTGLESMGINLPSSGRIGAGITFDGSGWFFPDAGDPEIGASPGGNWLDNSSFERNDAGGDFGWRLAVVDPTPVGPGVGTYNLFETALATPDDPTSNGFAGVSDAFHRAINFRVERETEITQVGAYMSGSGTLFAAIVETSGLFTKPDLSGGNVVATTLVELSGDFDGSDVAVDLGATLAPGTYALVFGSGAFGATGGDGSIRFGHIPNGDWSPYGVRQSDGQQTFSSGSLRYFVQAKSAPGTLQVRPSADVLAEVVLDDFSDDPESVRLIDGDPSITINVPFDSAEPRKYAVFEFPLDQVPLDRDLLSVTLELDVSFANIGTQFEVFGFAGDGAVGPQDAVGLQQVVGLTDITSTGIQTIDISVPFLQSLIGSATHLGLTIVPDETGQFALNTLETGQFGEPPLLTIALGPEPGLAGDYNGDGVVDVADYTVWRDSLGDTGPGLAADSDGDEDVDMDDYLTWRNNFGESLPAGAQESAAPEPGGLWLMLLGYACFHRRKERQPDAVNTACT